VGMGGRVGAKANHETGNGKYWNLE
jgi:hypothetical protein